MVAEGWLQRKVDAMKQDLSEKVMGKLLKDFDESHNFLEDNMVKLQERVKVMEAELEKGEQMMRDNEKMEVFEEKLSSVNQRMDKSKETSQNVMRAVTMALSEIVDIKDGQVKMVLMNELVTGKISKIEVAMDEKITTCLDDCDEKVTTCFDQCADQFFQQSEAVERSLNKKMVTKLEEAMVKIEYDLMVRFHGETLDFDEFQRLQRFGRESVQRKKHKPR